MPNRNANPFEADGPTEYEKWNYIVGQAHGQLIVNMATDVERVKALITEHNRLHEAANRAVLDMPAVSQTEKPS